MEFENVLRVRLQERYARYNDVEEAIDIRVGGEYRYTRVKGITVSLPPERMPLVIVDYGHGNKLVIPDAQIMDFEIQEEKN